MLQQALHIFKKDTYCLRYEIAAVLTMVVLPMGGSAFTKDSLSRALGGPFEFLLLLLPVAWCYLIARAVHAEPIPGDRQFWITRPYSRASLLLAKSVFILTWVNLPHLIAQAAILKLDGFRLLPNAGALLWEQVLITIVVTLPALALAAMTANMIQFVAAAGLIGALAVGSLVGLRDLGGVAWIARAALALLTLAVGFVILWLQYRLRKTSVSLGAAASGILLGVGLLILGPGVSAFAIQTKMSGTLSNSLRVDLGRDAGPPLVGRLTPKGSSVISLPLSVTGLPANVTLRCEGAEFTISTPSGARWSGQTAFNAPFRQAADWCVAGRSIDRSFLETHRDERVHIHGILSMTVFGNPRSTNLSAENPTAVPGVGQCWVLPPERDVVTFQCEAALRWPGLLVTGHAVDRRAGETFGTDLSYSPFPAEFSLIPVDIRMGRVAADTVTITTEEPLAHVRSEFDVPDIRLGDVESPTAH